jgi:hypothetical protein
MVVLVVAVAGIWTAIEKATKSSGPSASELKFDAFDVCTQIVKPRLKAPGTATFRDPTADNGDTVITPSADGAVFVISSSVDSENGFGAKLRSTFDCTVRHQTGTNFTLVSLDVHDGGAP